MNRYLIAGGAGFIGSHFIDELLGRSETEQVTVYDNFSSGQEWHYARHVPDVRLRVVRGEVQDVAALTAAAKDHETVIHLASNPDIAAAAQDPDLDFRQGTELTRGVAEAARIAGVNCVLYASGSGVYGECGEIELHEDHRMRPISTYGASKLAGEAQLCSYAHMFGFQVRAFRFANVVGPRQTHGVGLDFLRRLRQDRTLLRVLGDGRQSKHYIHVEDIVAAVLMPLPGDPFEVYNVSTLDALTVRDIAHMACEVLGIDQVRFEYGVADRGWKGDVPVVRLNSNRIRSQGWRPQRNSREAMQAALEAMAEHLASS